MKTVAAFIIFAVGSLSLAPAAGAWPNEHQVDTKTYDSNADAVVAIQDASGDVTVTGWDKNRIEVTTTKTAWSTEDLNRLGTHVDPHADRLTITTEYPKHCPNCDISFRVRVPSHAHVTIETSSGDVKVTSIGGPVRVSSSSGDVELMSVGGEVHVHSSSGDIKLDGMASPVDAYASSGDITARNLDADVNLVASSGSLSAEFARFDRVHEIRMESSSGDISLTVPRGVGFKVEANATSGSIQSNLRLPIRERDSGSDVSAQVGDGKASVQLMATSGDIDITMR